MITLEPVSKNQPTMAERMLLELGEGETGFSGTSFGEGKRTLNQFLVQTMDQHEGIGIPEGWVPQTTFWILYDNNAAGLLRLRHDLTASTRISGGHIGYYVSPRFRKRGIATKALSLSLPHAISLGLEEVMLTTSPHNVGSNKVIQDNGGRLRSQAIHPETEELVNQYWIVL